jgi:signal transduction histidine kinase/ActR/RegA family two-component response regulator
VKSPRTLAFVIAVDVAAIVAFVLLRAHHVEDPWVGIFLLSTLVALAGATPVRIPALKTSVSATDPFVFTALAAYGPMPACIVAAMGILGSMLGRERDRQPMHLVFNLGCVVLSIALASVVYALVGGRPGGPLPEQIGPLVAATTAYFVFNTGLVTTAVAIDSGRGFFATWRQSALWTAVSAYAGLTVSAGLLLALDWVGPSGLALGIPPCWLLVAFYRTNKQRQEEQERRIEQVVDHNQELEDKVAERTAELQRALSHIERSNAQLRLGNERLTEANRAKSEFLANVSHELRTPLNAIIGFSDLLREPTVGELNQEQTEFARDIHESGVHLLRLINDILDLSKIEAGKMEVHPEKVDLPQAIREAAAMLHPQATQERLTLTVRCAESVRTGRLDPGMFRQVLVNLLSNAVKFTPTGGAVTVEARDDGKDLVVEVADTGIGISETDLEKIFHEFYQVDGSYSRNYEGTGLGLALVRRMVEMQGGEISAQSTPDRGARFSVRYFNCLVDDPPVPRATHTAVDREEQTEPGGRILVVEDNPMNRKLARNVLRSKGYTVLEAPTAEAALELLRSETVDLVMMDIQLPGMDGLEATRRLKADPRTAGLPVVAVTAHALEADERRAREAGCIGYITKPIRLAQFPGQVASFLQEEAQPV